jgi:hypothetical protein
MQSQFMEHTCFNCGFVAFGKDECVQAERILLHANGQAGLPGAIETLDCSRHQWVSHDLGHGTTTIEEFNNQQRDCNFFFSYLPGISPDEHMKRLAERGQRKAQFYWTALAVLVGSILTLVGQPAKDWFEQKVGLVAPPIPAAASQGTAKK